MLPTFMLHWKFGTSEPKYDWQATDRARVTRKVGSPTEATFMVHFLLSLHALEKINIGF